MDAQKEYLGALGKLFLPFCSGKQLINLVKKHESSSSDTISGIPSPQKILKEQRHQVEFYKTSTLWITFRSIGLVVLLYMLLYWLYFYSFNSFSDHPPLVSVPICGIFSVCLWHLINGNALIFLHSFSLQPQKGSGGLVFLHLLCLLLVIGSYSFMRQENFISGQLFYKIGISSPQIGTIVSAILFGMTAIGLMILIWSLIQTVRKSVFYFSLSCHCLLLLCLIFLSKWLFGRLSFSAQDFAKFVNQGIYLYFAVLLCYGVLFCLYWIWSKKRYGT